MGGWPGRFSRINSDYLLIIGLLLAANAPYLANTFLPSHDTLQAFEGFYHYFTHFKQFREIPHWLYHGTYGTQCGFWQMSYLTPASYGIGLIAAVLGIESVLPLWKTTVLLEQFFFAAGLYLLARRLFTHRATVLLVTIGGVLSIVWTVQIWWNFRIFYLFPIGLYFLVTYADTKDSWRFWTAGIVFASSTIGNLIYFPIYWLLVIAVLFIVLGWGRAALWTGIFPARSAGIAAFSAFVVLAGIAVGHLSHMFDGLSTVVSGRDPDTLLSTLETFLSYGGRFDLGRYLQMAFIGWPKDAGWDVPVESGDNTVYIGLLPLLLYGYAWFHVRTRTGLAIMITGGVLFWFATGGLLATALFHIPSFSYVRHLVLLLGLMRVFILLGAGYGLDRLLDRGGIREVAVGFVLLLFLTDLIAADVIRDVVTGQWREVPGVQATFLRAFLLRLVLYSLCVALLFALYLRSRAVGPTRSPLPLFQRRTAAGLLLGCYILDLAMFQQATYSSASRIPEVRRDYTETTRAAPIEYQPTRTDQPPPGRSAAAFEQLALAQRRAVVLNESAYSYARFDPCQPKLHVLFRSRGVKRLLDEADKAPDPTAFLAQFMACGTPKITLKRDVTLVTSDKSAVEALRTGTRPVIRIAGAVPKIEDANGQSAATGAVEVVDFSANRCTIQVRVEDAPAWLIYADAWHPGWRAQIDGEDVSIAVANLAFKAVHLSPGEHTVKFTFDNDYTALFDNLIALWGIAAFALLSVFSIGLVFVRPGTNSSSPAATEA